MTDTLDCQDCGDVLWVLSAAERQEVAANPQNYVLLCGSCARLRESDALQEM